MTTHYLMSLEDLSTQSSFFDLIKGFFISSFSTGSLVVVLINLCVLFSRHWTWETLGLLIGVLQFYLNFTYFEYYSVFKTPIYGKDIVSMKDL